MPDTEIQQVAEVVRGMADADLAEMRRARDNEEHSLGDYHFGRRSALIDVLDRIKELRRGN